MKKVSLWTAMNKTAWHIGLKQKDSDGGVRVKAGCRLIDEYVEHSTPFNNYNAL